MLAQYKKPRKNPSAKVQQKKVVEKKREAKAKREHQNLESSSREVELTDSDVSDSSSSDSEYEEILISNLKKKPSPKIEEPLPSPKIEDPLPSPKIEESLPSPKKSRKKIVIKKYYQQRQAKSEKSEKSVEELPKSKPISIPQPQRTSYIGLGGMSNTSQTSHSMRNRLLNW